MAIQGDIQALGYFVVDSRTLLPWREFAFEVLGATVVPQDSVDPLRIRIDDHPWRIEIQESTEEKLHCVGWQVADAEALERLTKRIEAAGIRVTDLEAGVARERGVATAARFADPSGLEVELYLARHQSSTRFVSPCGVQFVTGPLGLGHLVLRVGAYRECVELYSGILGFGTSDLLTLGEMQITFLHCNRRHHSLALASGHGGCELLHFMLEVSSLDDVGYAFDRCEKRGIQLVKTIGRHSNDHMVSFYALTPSGFEVEYGWDGLKIDPASWTVRQLESPSLWGHRLLVARR
jgi:3,4-dihydroxy-9,10-secoandrosta-1,3,5(10)-triene-9,17-dione 4,5-dioxygenase